MADTNLTDLNKMKVVDLRKELKSRGLPSSGDKAELVDRLQTALTRPLTPEVKDDHGDENLVWDDDDIDSDGVLDEDEKDHHELLDDSAVELNEELALAEQTPAAEISRPSDSAPKPDQKPQRTLKRKITMSESAKEKSTDSKTDENKEVIAKKIVLNRSTSLNSITSTGAKIEVLEEGIKSENSSTDSGKIKVTASIDAKTRLELRAKRFGLPVKKSDIDRKEARKERFGQSTGNRNASISGDMETNMDKLKKRAERFGQSVSKFMTEVEIKDKLEKRKEKFGTVK